MARTWNEQICGHPDQIASFEFDLFEGKVLSDFIDPKALFLFKKHDIPWRKDRTNMIESRHSEALESCIEKGERPSFSIYHSIDYTDRLLGFHNAYTAASSAESKQQTEIVQSLLEGIGQCLVSWSVHGGYGDELKSEGKDAASFDRYVRG